MRWSYTCLIVVAIEFVQYVLALNTMSTVRCCSRCRCPGHTAKNCNVFKPTSLTYYEPSGPGDLERAEVRGIIKEIRRIHALGKPAMTQHECIRAWIAKGNDSSRLSSSRMDCARRCHESDRAKILGVSTEAARRRIQDSAELARRRIQNSQPARTRPTVPVSRIARVSVFTNDEDLIRRFRASPAPAVSPKIQVREAAVEETVCAICAENLTDCDKYVTPCGHQFHGSCAMKWMQRSKLCATCREPVIA